MDDKVGESGKKWSILTKGARRPGMLFRGQSYRSLDGKGRLMLPPEFRDALAAASADGAFVLTTYDGCLVSWPPLERTGGAFWASSEQFEENQGLSSSGARRCGGSVL